MNPSVWPYGLEACRSAFNRPVLLDDGRLDSVQPMDAVAFWHERLLIRRSVWARSARRYSGVIWYTDGLSSSLNRAVLGPAYTAALIRTQGLWCLSRPQVDRIRDMLGTRCPSVKWLQFGVDPDYFSFSPYPDSKLIVSIGNDIDRDARTTISIMSRLHSLDSDVMGLVQTPLSLPSAPGVRVVKSLSRCEVLRAYRDSAVVLICTRNNWHVSGMTTALEAEASGRPVVATDSPGFGDYVIDGQTGFLADRGDHDALLDRTRWLINNPSDAARMGANGRRLVETTLSSRLAADRYSDLLSAWIQ